MRPASTPRSATSSASTRPCSTLREKIQDGELGQVFLVATERIGPFPDRVRDVGVVKDLATHDLDLVRWLGGAPVERVSAETQHRMGREHEDLVLATGRLENAISFNCVVDWLSPTKVRQTRVLGERGMLVADTLTADLTFYRNGKVASDWENTQSLRGVSEGDSTRYALARREPLLVELETFCDLLEGDGEAAGRHAVGGPGHRRSSPRPCWPARRRGETVVLVEAAT